MDDSSLKLNTPTPSPLSVPENVYTATEVSADDLLRGFPYYKQVMDSFKSGDGQVELRKRYMLKALDEAWINAVEDAIPALDLIIRNPGFSLQEVREVLPVERTRKVSDSSIQHLCQHTDYINEIKPDGTVIPSKLLNVYQDETIFTYENKFINTLLARLYVFVARRHDAAEACGEDEKNTRLSIERAFEREGQKGKISLTIEVSEKPQDREVVRNYIYTTDLWARVKRIYKIVTEYMDSKFVQELGKAYIRPPLMRTNKILKNVNFHQCQLLWEFLDSYDNTGYETILQEDLERVDEKCLADMYNTLAMQYVIFQSNIHTTFDPEKQFDVSEPIGVIRTKFKDELEPLDERELDVPVQIPESIEDPTSDLYLLEQSVRVALEADKFFIGEEADEEEELNFNREGQIVYRYRYSFLARVIRAQNPLQDYYSAIKNHLLAYTDVKNRISWKHETFNSGRTKCAMLNVKGKTLCLYLPLDPSEYAVSKYHHNDLRNEGGDEVELPFLLKVRSDRGLKYAIELIDDAMAKSGIVKNPEYIPEDYHMPLASNEDMARRDPPLVKIIDGQPLETMPAPAPVIGPEYDEIQITKYSFTAKLIKLGNPTQEYYSEIKNKLLAGIDVKSRTSWGYETFNSGRKKLAKLVVKGKTLCLLMSLNPAEYETSKYHHIDLSQKNPNKTQDYPFMLKVKSGRSLKYACKLAEDVLSKHQIQLNESYSAKNFRFKKMSEKQMLNANPPLAKKATRKVKKSDDE